jgi:hypothetical protein
MSGLRWSCGAGSVATSGATPTVPMGAAAAGLSHDRGFALDEKNRRHISGQQAERRRETEALEARVTQLSDEKERLRRKNDAAAARVKNLEKDLKAIKGKMKVVVRAMAARPWVVHAAVHLPRSSYIRVRVEIMGPGNYENVGKSQSVLLMINPSISSRTRTSSCWLCTSRARRAAGGELEGLRVADGRLNRWAGLLAPAALRRWRRA